MPRDSTVWIEGSDRAELCVNRHFKRLMGDGTSSNTRSKYCEKCGGEFISDCSNCREPVKISWRTNERRGTTPNDHYVIPDFCPRCSKAYPWTGRQAHIYELKRLLRQDDGIDEPTKLQVQECLTELQNTDLDEHDQLAILKKIKTKAPGFLKDTGRDIIVSIVSETIVNAL